MVFYFPIRDYIYLQHWENVVSDVLNRGLK